MARRFRRELRFIFDDIGWFGTVLVILFLLAWPVIFYLAYLEHQDWTRFKADKNCRIVGKMDGSMVNTIAPVIGGNGGVAIGVAGTPSKTGWMCDDGITYWR